MADRNSSSNKPDEVVKALVNSNDQMGKEMEYLKNRLNALEMMQQPSQHQPQNNGGAIAGIANTTATAGSDQAVASNNANNNGDNDAVNKPPMRRIKFLDHHPLASNIVTNSPQNSPLLATTQDNNNNNNNNNDDNDNNSESSSSVSSNEAIAFSGWARVFFQARHHHSATQITSGATSTDTYLYLTIHSTSNELRISNTDDRWKPPLIDPPIPLKYFYALKVPGSHSGAALFLKNDSSRRLRKYIFRFEFINRSVHQPPARYIQFIRSGKAAKKSMMGINRMKNALNKQQQRMGYSGEERNENLKADKKRAQDAFAAHLGTLDELLRESSESADRFVECVNTRNEEEELNNMNDSGGGMMGESGQQRRKRSKPPPPYWGSGFNRPSTNEHEEDEDNVDSDSLSEEDDELYYDDDNDDETLFDKVQVSTEQTLETLFNHIVK